MPKQKPSIKTCHMCARTMAAEAFVRSQWICKECRPEYRQQSRTRLKEQGPRKIVEAKSCLVCNEHKQASDFYKDSNTSDGLSSYCSMCNRKRKARHYQSNAKEIRHRVITRRAASYNPEICDLTSKQWEDVVDAYGGRCAYCNTQDKMVQDHLIPLSRGGHHTLENVTPACQSCNSKKSTKTPLEFFLWEIELAS